MTEEKITVDDIIGLVDCEPTNSVEEVKKLCGRENRTKKRFTIFGEWHKDCVIDEIRDNTGEYVTIGRVVDLLNENEQLKKDCTVLICHNQEYRKENEQLKQSINEVVELLSEEVDLFSDKATEHDINAYVELKELDNKDAYYMATATKKAIKILKGCLNDFH